MSAVVIANAVVVLVATVDVDVSIPGVVSATLAEEGILVVSFAVD